MHVIFVSDPKKTLQTNQTKSHSHRESETSAKTTVTGQIGQTRRNYATISSRVQAH